MTDTEKAVRGAIIVSACLSQFDGDNDHFELLLGYSDGREIGHVVRREALHLIGNEFLHAAGVEYAQASELDAVRAERDRIDIENVELRHVVSNCAAALVTGAFVSPKCSVEFMQGVPNEISSTVASLRDERDQQHTRILELQMLAWKWMEAHDKLKAGIPYDYPTATDVPDVVAERDRLREALEPFADAADYYLNGVHRQQAPDALPCGPALLVGHLRAARAALSPALESNHVK